MEEATFRILEALSRNLGTPLSIRGLTREIQKRHKSAYYANVYHKVQTLGKQGYLQVSPSRGATTVSLDFQSYALIDLLAEMEIHRKRKAILDHRLQNILATIDEGLSTARAAAWATDPERNLRLNRMELLVLSSSPWTEVNEALEGAGRMHNTRIDILLLEDHELLDRLSVAHHDPVKEMFQEGVAVILPQVIWSTIARGSNKGQRLTISPLSRPTLGDLPYNLERFGYDRLGKTGTGEPACLEETVIGALTSKNTRNRLAAAVVLGKNEANPRILAFLAVKQGVEGHLLGLVQAMEKVRADTTLDAVRSILKSLGTKARPVDSKAVEKTMGVYHAT